MPIKHAIWTVGDSPTPLSPDRLLSEQKLEDMIVADPSILSADWMLIGRQEPTPFGGRIDLLAIMPDASLAFVRVEWLDTVPENKAFNEVGLFGNQNTVCQPTTPKWRHTVERLKTYFKKWE